MVRSIYRADPGKILKIGHYRFPEKKCFECLWIFRFFRSSNLLFGDFNSTNGWVISVVSHFAKWQIKIWKFYLNSANQSEAFCTCENWKLKKRDFQEDLKLEIKNGPYSPINNGNYAIKGSFHGKLPLLKGIIGHIRPKYKKSLNFLKKTHSLGPDPQIRWAFYALNTRFWGINPWKLGMPGHNRHHLETSLGNITWKHNLET